MVGGDPYAGSRSPKAAGNSCLMRMASVVLRFQDRPRTAIRMAMRQSAATHRASECHMASALMAEILLHSLQVQDKGAALAPSQSRLPVTPALAIVARGDYKTKSEAEIKVTAALSTTWRQRFSALKNAIRLTNVYCGR